jgi:hypothetical protein
LREFSRIGFLEYNSRKFAQFADKKIAGGLAQLKQARAGAQKHSENTLRERALSASSSQCLNARFPI